MTCSTSPRSSRSADSRRMCTWRCAAPSPAANCARSSPRPTTRCGGPPRQQSASTATSLPGLGRGQRDLPGPGNRRGAAHLGPGARCHHRPGRAAARRPVRGPVRRPGRARRITGREPVHRLPDQVPDQAPGRLPRARHRHPAGARRTARRGAALGTLLTGLRELAPLRHPAEERQEGPAARCVQGQGTPPRIPRLRRAARADLPQMVRQDAGRPPRRAEEPG